MNKLIPSFFGAIAFYTIIKIPTFFQPSFERIARWISFVGLLIGNLLWLADFGLTQVNLPVLTRSVLIVSFWIYLTGGLHLDGVIDTADGLAIQGDQKRRLEVMKDSVTGAFGVMAAIIVVLIKTFALSELTFNFWLSLMIVSSWSRWGQLMAIAFYPYLRAEGKGAFHKENLNFPQDCFFGSMFIPILVICEFLLTNQQWWLILLTQLGCAVIALLTGFWFNHKLGGHTGDTYGATIEWSEAFILCFLTAFS